MRSRADAPVIIGRVKPVLVVLVVAAVIVIGIAAWAIGVNNSLVALEQNVNEKWAQVQNVYQRRADLIPNLVETVKGFATQERTVLEDVTRARASATGVQLTPEALNDPKALERFQQVQNQLTGALSRLMVTVEDRLFSAARVQVCAAAVIVFYVAILAGVYGVAKWVATAVTHGPQPKGKFVFRARLICT